MINKVMRLHGIYVNANNATKLFKDKEGTFLKVRFLAEIKAKHQQMQTSKTCKFIGVCRTNTDKIFFTDLTEMVENRFKKPPQFITEGDLRTLSAEIQFSPVIANYRQNYYFCKNAEIDKEGVQNA